MDQSFKRQMMRLLRSGDYSDFTIGCFHLEWRVHRAILAARSPFFEKFMRDNPDTDKYVIRVPWGTQDIIDLLLQVFYTGDYSLRAVPDAYRAISDSLAVVQQEVTCHGVLRRLGELYAINNLIPLTLAHQRAVLNAHVRDPTFDLDWLISPYYLGWRGTGFIPHSHSWLAGHQSIIEFLSDHIDIFGQREDFRNFLRAIPRFEVDLANKNSIWRRRRYVGSRGNCKCHLPGTFRLVCKDCGMRFIDGKLEARRQSNPEPTRQVNGAGPSPSSGQGHRYSSSQGSATSPVDTPMGNGLSQSWPKKEEQNGHPHNHDHAANGVATHTNYPIDPKIAEFIFPEIPNDGDAPIDCPCHYPTPAVFACGTCNQLLTEFIEEVDAEGRTTAAPPPAPGPSAGVGTPESVS